MCMITGSFVQEYLVRQQGRSETSYQYSIDAHFSSTSTTIVTINNDIHSSIENLTINVISIFKLMANRIYIIITNEKTN